MFQIKFILYIVIIAFAWIIYRWKYIKLGFQIPSNRLHTFLGWGKLIDRKGALAYVTNYNKKYGPDSVFWLGPLSFFLTTNPKSLKDILTAKNCIKKPIIYRGISSIIGEGLISENEPNWSRHRKIMNKAFSPATLKSFFPLFHNEINNLIEQIESRRESRENIDLLVIFRAFTMRIASKTTLKRNLEQTEFNSYTMSDHAHEIFEFAADTCINPIRAYKWICKLAEICLYKRANKGLQMFRRLIAESVDIYQKNGVKDPSYLPEVNSVLEYAFLGIKQNTLYMNEIEAQMTHVFFGVFETTSTTLYLVILMLAMHPQYQERAFEEITSTLSTNDSEITYEMVEQLTYLDMIFKETMRLFPPIPTVFREVTGESLTLSDGVKLPVGQMICIDIYSLHRRTELYGPHADAFNPDNFLASNVAARDPFSYIPFTKGQRVCIGMRYAEIFFKISLAKLIATYRFTTDFKYKDIIVENHISVKLVEEPHIYLEKRV